MKKLALLTAGSFFALTAAASAADITNPFYIPAKTVMSDTSFNYEHNIVKVNGDKEKSYEKSAGEKLTFGFNDAFAVNASVKRIWERDAGEADHDNNNVTGIGLTWKPVDTQSFKMSVNADFATFSATKIYSGDVMFGYLPSNNVMLLAQLGYNETREKENGNYENDRTPSVMVGAYAKQGAVNAFAGVKYDHEKAKEDITDLYNLTASVGYQFNDKAALELNSTYLLHVSYKYKPAPAAVDVKADRYTIGANIKFVF